MDRARRAGTAALVIALILVSVGSPGGASRASAADVAWPVSTLVVSELQTGGASASDEFVEIANQGAGPVDLVGLELVYATSSGSTVTRKASWDASFVLDAGRRVLVVNGAGVYTALGDKVYTGGFAATGGAVALRVIGGTVVDALGWGDATNPFVEGGPAVAPPAGSSLERSPGGTLGNGVDTNDNALDWFVNPAPNPQRSSDGPVPAPGPTPTPSPTPTPTPSPTPTPDADARRRRLTPTPTPDADAHADADPDSDPDAHADPNPDPDTESGAVDRPPDHRGRASPPGRLGGHDRGHAHDGARCPREWPNRVSPGCDGRHRRSISMRPSSGPCRQGRPSPSSGTLDTRYAQRTLRAAEADIVVIGQGAVPEAIAISTGGRRRGVRRPTRVGGRVRRRWFGRARGRPCRVRR